MDMDGSPARQDQLVRNRLRQLREGAGLTQHEVATAMDWSASKVLRLENGGSRIDVGDVKLLLQHYGVTDPGIVQDFVQSARVARTRTWRDKYRKLIDSSFYEYLGFEAAALEIRQYQSTSIPDLLQTQSYARAISSALYDPPEIAAHVAELCKERQRALLRGAPSAQMTFVVDEAALRRSVGDPSVMRDQLLRLKQVVGMPNVVIQVVPFSSGVHPGMRGSSFTIFDLAGGARTVFYEMRRSQTVIRGGESVTLIPEQDFSAISGIALLPDETAAFVDRLVAELNGER